MTKPIKLLRIVFEGPIQIWNMTVREYQIIEGSPSRYEAHLHGDLQCVVIRDPAAGVTILIPLRCVRSMEAEAAPASSSGEGLRNMQEEYRKQLAFKVPTQDDTGPLTAPPAASSYSEPHDEPRRRGRPRTKHLGQPSDKL